MNWKGLRSFASIMTAASLMLSFSAGAFAQPQAADDFSTTTPIKHVVIIFKKTFPSITILPRIRMPRMRLPASPSSMPKMTRLASTIC